MKNGKNRQSFYRFGWMFYGMVALVPYLTGIYLILESNPSTSGRLLTILIFTAVLIVAGAVTMRIFTSRLRFMTRLMAAQAYGGGAEQLPVDEGDIEEIYSITRDFNSVVDELQRTKKESRDMTARMLAYIDDLDRYEKKLRDETLIRANLSRYVSDNVVEELVRSEQFAFENVACTATILFADMRGFTAISEPLDPEDTIAMLNGYFGIMVPIVFKYGGTLDKFIGDELMAIFRDNPYGERAALRAVRAAIEMIEAVEAFNQQQGLAAESAAAIGIGVGINTGRVVIGNVGSANRKDYTAIGDTVNVAARFEQMAAGGEIVVGPETYLACKESIAMAAGGEIVLKNRKAPVHTYKVMEARRAILP